MQKFIQKICLYILLPLSILMIAEAFSPMTLFTHRHFEAIRYGSSVPHLHTHYPNFTSDFEAVGDLCHHTKKAIKKNEFWISDSIGFRNDTFIKHADILFIGDSFIQGNTLSQDNTITNKVNKKLHGKYKSYNMASSTLSEFDKYLTLGIIKKPKLLVYSIVERNNPEAIIRYKKGSSYEGNSCFENNNLNIYFDKALKFNSLNWIKSRLLNSKGKGVIGTNNSNMYFLNGTKQIHNKEDLSLSSSTIISYKKYCDSLGIKFIFLPMPNKETVYYKNVPFEVQDSYLFKLDSILKLNKIESVNTLAIYNHYLKNNTKLLYHLDDTHWNENATELIASTLVEKYFIDLD